MVFEGSNTEAQILKHKLQDVDILALLKNDARGAATAGFGSVSVGSSKVFVNPEDAEKAKVIAEKIKV